MSDQLQLVAKEQERNKLLYSSAPQTSSTASASLKTPSASKLTAKESTRTPAAKRIKKAGRGGDKDEEETGEMSLDKAADTRNEGLDGDGAKARRKSAGKKGSVTTKQTQPETNTQPTPTECEYSAHSQKI